MLDDASAPPVVCCDIGTAAGAEDKAGAEKFSDISLGCYVPGLLWTRSSLLKYAFRFVEFNFVYVT